MCGVRTFQTQGAIKSDIFVYSSYNLYSFSNVILFFIIYFQSNIISLSIFIKKHKVII